MTILNAKRYVVRKFKVRPAPRMRHAFNMSMSLLTVCSALLVSSPATAAGDGRDQALQSFQIRRLEATLKAAADGPTREYFNGMAANREGRLWVSIRLLTAALPSLRRSSVSRAALALQALTDDYGKLFEYKKAAASAEELLASFATELSPIQRQGVEDDAAVYRILSDTPRQTIGFAGPVALQTGRNVLGSLEADLSVNGVGGKWLLDTGANMSVVTHGFAERLRLQPLPGSARVQALTGVENTMRVAVIPTLRLGGAILHHVVVLVLPDKDLNIPYDKEGHRYQINAIIGYPVLQALGRLTFRRDGRLLAGDLASDSHGGVRMYMKGLRPVIECKMAGHSLPFSFDTGASRTELLTAYYERFKSQAPHWQQVEKVSAGAGGAVRKKGFVQRVLKLQVGARTATLRDVMIDAADTGVDNAAIYGNLGQDFVSGFDSFTIDFRSMRFSLGEPLGSPWGAPNAR
ncbi:MAG TPA: pepsin/retropepsin-like aspartic protease family protein [Steroidobacteraceae bacterium]|nr:pepsin/retropepsin-like aspartic protease family protein [Steroidobacteraceae bacterium]